MSETYITEEMRALVGREYHHARSFPISESDIRKWAMAVYYPDPPPRLYWDEAYARTTRWGGIVAPEEFNPFAWMAADPGQVIRNASIWPEPHFGVTPPQTRATVLTSVEAAYSGERMRPGDVIQSAISLKRYDERTGRLGLMLFTTREDRWTNQRGEHVATHTWTFIRYR